MADHMRLAADFAGGSREDWLKAVEKALKGRPLESLTRMTDDGIAVAPLYTRDASAARVTDALPGAAPFVRGAHAWRPAEAPWTIAQVHTHPIPAVANAAMLADLEGGVSGLVLRLHVLGHSEVPSAL
ncbi:MAG: methylmalonyl-CoA mutase family protein, partial [Pseudomonadota bacterium]